MSEVTTLKQLMLDAARYRWWRENCEEFWWDLGWERPDPEHVDSHIDSKLAKENP